jgi:hypothetical protein
MNNTRQAAKLTTDALFFLGFMLTRAFVRVVSSVARLDDALGAVTSGPGAHGETTVTQRLSSIGLAIVLASGWGLAVMSRLAGAADIDALLTRAGAAGKSGDHAASIDALEQALAKVRVEAPLGAKPFLLVTQPAKYFGDYTPRPNAAFRGGEAQHFYLELKNLVNPRSAAGAYEPAFDVDLQILTAADQVVASQERFAAFRLPTKSPVQDIFLNLDVKLGGVPPGEYKVRFVVRDANSKKTLTVTQPITMK